MELTSKSRNSIFIVLLTGSIVSSLLQTAMTTLIPLIMSEYRISATAAQWLTSAYSLTMGIMIPATAYLLRRFPLRHLFIFGMGMFSIGSLLCALSTSFSFLMLGRILQAMGSGLMLSMTQVVVLTIYPANRRGTVMGIFGLASGVAPIFAPTLAGIIADVLNWHYLFWAGLILAVLDILFALVILKNVLEIEKLSFDIASMLLCAVGFTGLILGLGNIGSYAFFSLYVGFPLLIGIIGLLIFSLRQLKISNPFLELRTLKNHEFCFSVIISMLLYGIMIAGSTLIPIYLQTVHSLSTTVSGLVMMPGSLIMALINPFTGKVFDKFGIRKLAIIGSIFMVISCAGFVVVSETTSVVYVSALFILRLIAVGCVMMPVTTWGISTIEQIYTSHSTALLTTLRTISGAIGSAVFVAVLTAATNASGNSKRVMANVPGVRTAFFWMTIVTLLQFFITLVFVGKKRRKIGNGIR